MADLCSLVLPSSDHEWQLHISIVISNIGRWNGITTGRSRSPILSSSNQEWQLHISIVISHICRRSGRSMGKTSLLWYCLLVIMNGNYTFNHIGRWNGRTTGRSRSPILPSSDQEWQLHISIVISHIGRGSGRYIPLVLPSSDHEWQLHISTVITHIDRWSGRSTGWSTPNTAF